MSNAPTPASGDTAPTQSPFSGQYRTAPSLDHPLRGVWDDAAAITRITNGDALMLANRILDAVGAPIREAKSDPAPAGDDREPIIAANDAEAYREMAGGKLKWAINTYEDDGSLSWHDISQALYALRHAFVILSAPAPESKGMDLEAEQDAWVKWYDEEAETHLGIRAISWKTWIACARRLRAGAEGGK